MFKGKMTKKEEPKQKIEKPFTFVNLGVDIQPEDIMESDRCFLYSESCDPSFADSVMIPAANVYDEMTNIYMGQAHMYDHLGFENPMDYQDIIDEMIVQYTKRILNNLSQNIYNIYFNGLGCIINNFKNDQLSSEEYNLSYIRTANPTAGLEYRTNNIFGEETIAFDFEDADEFYVSNKGMDKHKKIPLDPRSDAAMRNMMKAYRMIFNSVNNAYASIINNVLTGSAAHEISIEKLVKFALGNNEEVLKKIPPTMYISLATNLLNEYACDDLKKISEVIEICVTQGFTEFYRDVINAGLITLDSPK